MLFERLRSCSCQSMLSFTRTIFLRSSTGTFSNRTTTYALLYMSWSCPTCSNSSPRIYVSIMSKNIRKLAVFATTIEVLIMLTKLLLLREYSCSVTRAFYVTVPQRECIVSNCYNTHSHRSYFNESFSWDVSCRACWWYFSYKWAGIWIYHHLIMCSRDAALQNT